MALNKDAWIVAALKTRYLKPETSGDIHRWSRADENGKLYEKGRYFKITQQVHKRSGRVYFNLTFMGITKSVLVNRVIALAFLPNPDKLPQVNHLDGNKENNALSNLEWSTGQDNEKHAHATGLKTGRGSSNANVKLTADEVLAIRESSSDYKELAQTYGVSRSTIHNIKTRKTWVHL